MRPIMVAAPFERSYFRSSGYGIHPPFRIDGRLLRIDRILRADVSAFKTIALQSVGGGKALKAAKHRHCRNGS